MTLVDLKAFMQMMTMALPTKHTHQEPHTPTPGTLCEQKDTPTEDKNRAQRPPAEPSVPGAPGHTTHIHLYTRGNIHTHDTETSTSTCGHGFMAHAHTRAFTRTHTLCIRAGPWSMSPPPPHALLHPSVTCRGTGNVCTMVVPRKRLAELTFGLDAGYCSVPPHCPGPEVQSLAACSSPRAPPRLYTVRSRKVDRAHWSPAHCTVTTRAPPTSGSLASSYWLNSR